MSEASERHAHLGQQVMRCGWGFFGTGAASVLASWAGYEPFAQVFMGLCILSVFALVVLQWHQRKAFMVMRLEQGASRKEAIDEWAKTHEPI